MRAVYIHIPFCNSICSYCDFCKFLKNEQWEKLYLDTLDKEIDKYYEDDNVKSVYIGGGSPSCLSSSSLIRLFFIINKIKVISGAEITFECNINDINSELLTILKKNNVNRLSIGVESFDEKNLAFLGRKHNKKDIINNIKLAKEMGFDNINVYLIYALPNEKLMTVRSDISKLLKLNIEHISTYSLIIEEHTKIYNDKVKPIDEVLDYKMYKYICEKLSDNGFIHYEVSNFAKKGHQSEHNLTYWNNDEYYGFGLAAHGFINNIRYENTRNLNKYLNGNYRLNELLVSNREDMENEIILGFRKLEGVSVTKFRSKFNADIFKVFNFDEVLNKRYVLKDGDYLYIPEEKIYVMNEILNMIIK